MIFVIVIITHESRWRQRAIGRKAAAAPKATEKTKPNRFYKHIFVYSHPWHTWCLGGSCRHGRAVEFPGASDG